MTRISNILTLIHDQWCERGKNVKAQRESVPLGDEASIVCRRYAERDPPHAYHFHPEVELTLIERGEGQRFVGDDVSRFGAGDLVLVGADVPHLYVGDTMRDDPGRIGLASVVVHFRPEVLGESWWARAELRAVTRLLAGASPGWHFTGPTARRVAEGLADLPGREGLPRLLNFLGLLGELALGGRARRIGGTAGVRVWRTEDAARMDRVVRHVRAHLAEPVPLAVVARLAGLTPPAFCRYFKRVRGCTFSTFVNDLRVAEAARRLRVTEDTITRIGYECGFGTASQFYAEFKRRRGCAPGAWRRRG